MIQKHLHLTLYALAGLLAAGCVEDKTAPRRPVIGLSVLTLTNPFFQEIADNLQQEAVKLGYDVVVVSGEFDAARQQNQVKDFIVRKAAAIVLCPCESKAVGPAIQEAHDAGIPVFTCDIACLASEAKYVVTHVATDNFAGGQQAAHALLEALGDSGGKVAILGFPAAESCLLRVAGFKEVIEAHNHGGGAPVKIVAELPCGGVKDQGYKAAEDLVQSYPDLAGIFAINDPSALAPAALEKADKDDQVKIVGFDGQPEGKQAIKQGKIYADPVQYPDRIGRETARVIVRYFEGENVARQILIPTELYRKKN